jgi:hypothetical protein
VRQRAVLERFLRLAEQAGAFEGVSQMVKAMILRFARVHPERTYRQIDQLVELWRCARGEIPEEDHDEQRTDPRSEPGRADQLVGDAHPHERADRRAPGRAPRPAAAAGSAPGRAAPAGAGAGAGEGARR